MNLLFVSSIVVAYVVGGTMGVLVMCMVSINRD